MSTKIKQYQNSDLDQLLSVWLNASRLAHPFLSKSFLEQESYNIPNLYIPMADTWILTEDDVVVGFIALISNEVGALFVDPKHHGKGYGKALMDKAQSLHNVLEVDVFKENHIGRNFYKQYGFIYQQEKLHEPTGQVVLRLIYTR